MGRWVVGIGIVLALGATAVACGGDDDDLDIDTLASAVGSLTAVAGDDDGAATPGGSPGRASPSASASPAQSPSPEPPATDTPTATPTDTPTTAPAAATPTPTTAPPPAAAATVEVVDNRFDSPFVLIKPGETVTWVWKGANQHSVNGSGMNSGIKTSGTYSFTFTSSGQYEYQCGVHGAEMSGVIVVE